MTVPIPHKLSQPILERTLGCRWKVPPIAGSVSRLRSAVLYSVAEDAAWILERAFGGSASELRPRIPPSCGVRINSAKAGRSGRWISSRLAEERTDDIGLPVGVPLPVLAELLDQPELDGVVLGAGVSASTKEISKLQVVTPLLAAMVDDVDMSNPVPRPNFADEHVTTVVACIAAVDPTSSLEFVADWGNFVMVEHSNGKVDNRLGQQADDRRRTDLLDASDNAVQDRRCLIPE